MAPFQLAWTQLGGRDIYHNGDIRDIRDTYRSEIDTKSCCMAHGSLDTHYDWMVLPPKNCGSPAMVAKTMRWMPLSHEKQVVLTMTPKIVIWNILVIEELKIPGMKDVVVVWNKSKETAVRIFAEINLHSLLTEISLTLSLIQVRFATTGNISNHTNNPSGLAFFVNLKCLELTCLQNGQQSLPAKRRQQIWRHRSQWE